MKALLIADHDGKHLSRETARALTAALQLGGTVDVIVAGENARAIADEAAVLQGTGRVLLADGEAHRDQLSEPLATLVAELAVDYDAVVGTTSSSSKSVLPRVAALLDVMQISDVIAVLSHDTFKRPVYAGNAIQTLRSNDTRKVLSIRTTAFAEATVGPAAPIEVIAPGPASTVSHYVSAMRSSGERPELSAARIVVSGGRAFESREQFEALVLPLADALGAAVGASRAAVDAGFAANDLQVGQTGKIVAPQLYFALGISGAIQHIAGIKDARTIVAINKDREAPIFEVADYGLVGDIRELVPLLTAAVKK